MAKQIFIRIITWLGIMAGLTLIALAIWYLALGGSQTTESLKWLQFMQTLGTFLIPPILCAWIWDTNHQPFAWLKITNHQSPITNQKWLIYLIAILIMIVAIPAINFLADLNSRIVLPKSLDFIEQIFKQQEDAAAALTERFLQADNIGQLLINIGLLALLPALAEELSFRGTLQQILCPENSQFTNQKSQIHIAVWVTAIVFSAIHMQFYGFIPRMLMGAMFGYVFLWTGSLWIPILMHFTNNCIAVIAYYLTSNSQEPIVNSQQNIADTIGAGDTWWLGVISILITSLGLLIFYRRTHIR